MALEFYARQSKNTEFEREACEIRRFGPELRRAHAVRGRTAHSSETRNDPCVAKTFSLSKRSGPGCGGAGPFCARDVVAQRLSSIGGLGQRHRLASGGMLDPGNRRLIMERLGVTINQLAQKLYADSIHAPSIVDAFEIISGQRRHM
jgi:hypothetical protein